MVHIRHFVSHRPTRRRFVRNILARQRYHADRYQPFGYTRDMYRYDKGRAITGRLAKGRDFH